LEKIILIFEARCTSNQMVEGVHLTLYVDNNERLANHARYIIAYFKEASSLPDFQQKWMLAAK
jgi:hypothetical protein